MGNLIMKGLILGLCLLISSLTVSLSEEVHPCTYRTLFDSAWGTIHIIENRFLEVGIAKPAGRITSLVFKPTGNNFLYSEGVPWDGLIEWVKIGSGMLFTRFINDFKIYPPYKEKNSLSITVEAELKDKERGYHLLLKRTMRIWKDLPILEISTECRNEGEKELKEFSYGFHPQLTIGGDSKNDLIFIPEEGIIEGIDFYKVKKRRWDKISSNWFGGIDQKNGEGLFFLFPKNSIGWVDKYTRFNKFYNLETYYKPISLVSKSTVNYKVEIVLTSGMKIPILVKNNMVLVTLTTQKKKYFSNEDVGILLTLHSEIVSERKEEIDLIIQKGGNILKRWKEVLPFKHGILNLTWNTRDREDGIYQVICSLNSKEEIGRVSTQFEICGKIMKEAESIIIELKNALSSAQKGKEWEQKILWANSFLEEAKKSLQREDYEMAKNWAKRGIEKIE